MHQRGQKGSGGQDHRRSKIVDTTFDSHAAYHRLVARLFFDQIGNHFLPQFQIRLVLNRELDPVLVALLVRLSPWAVHGWTFANVQHAKLNAGRIDRLAHQATQRIDFANHVAFADPADRRIAAHLADGIQVRCDQRRLRAQPSCSGSGFGSRMTGSDNNDIVLVFNVFHTL